MHAHSWHVSLLLLPARLHAPCYQEVFSAAASRYLHVCLLSAAAAAAATTIRLYEKVNGKRQTNQIRFSPPQYKDKYHSDVRLKELGVTNSTIDVSSFKFCYVWLFMWIAVIASGC
jgi:hypothetical protein